MHEKTTLFWSSFGKFCEHSAAHFLNRALSSYAAENAPVGNTGGLSLPRLYVFSVSLQVLPIGRIFGRGTQKGTTKNVKIVTGWKICGRIFTKRAEKGPIL